jgi:hypothetical protein
MQECVDISGIRDMILNHLGGSSKYQMFTTQIGSNTTSLGYHGFIALTLYVKANDLDNGFVVRLFYPNV